MGKAPIDLQNKLFYHPEKLQEFFKSGNTTPVTWELDPTNRCNHNCIGCYAAGAGGRTNDDSLTWEQAKSYVDQVHDLGAKAINLTGGGDPMVNKITPKLIQYIKSLGMDVGMITNGTIFTDESIDIVVQNCTWVRISMDGGTPEVYTEIRKVPERHFYLAFENMRKLVRRKQELNSNITIGSGFLTSTLTVPSLVTYAELCKEAGIDYIQIRPFHGDYTIPYNIEETLALEDSNFKIHYSKNKYEEGYKKKYLKCLAQTFSGVINVHSVYLCCHFRGVETKKLGDLREKTLLEIWAGRKRMIVLEELNLDKCIAHCRLDLVNRQLQDMLDSVPDHVNFI